MTLPHLPLAPFAPFSLPTSPEKPQSLALVTFLPTNPIPFRPSGWKPRRHYNNLLLSHLLSILITPCPRASSAARLNLRQPMPHPFFASSYLLFRPFKTSFELDEASPALRQVFPASNLLVLCLRSCSSLHRQSERVSHYPKCPKMSVLEFGV